MIRFATLADAMKLRGLSEVTFRDAYSEYNTSENIEKHVDLHFSIEQIEKELQEPDVRYIVIEKDDALIAFTKFVTNHKCEGLETGKALEIERIYVAKEFQGLKSGARMIDFCIDWAKEKGFETVWLGVWEHNHNALRFYEKMGFVRVGQHDFMLGDEIQTDYLMKKHL